MNPPDFKTHRYRPKVQAAVKKNNPFRLWRCLVWQCFGCIRKLYTTAW